MKFLNKLLALFGRPPVFSDADVAAAYGRGFDSGRRFGIEEGKQLAKVQFAVLPLPFTDDQLKGRDYGTFITPAGFATAFGECTVPAPGPHGYEQRAYYVDKHNLDFGADLFCQNPAKFHNPADSAELVPVIVTVLR